MPEAQAGNWFSEDRVRSIPLSLAQTTSPGRPLPPSPRSSSWFSSSKYLTPSPQHLIPAHSGSLHTPPPFLERGVTSPFQAPIQCQAFASYFIKKDVNPSSPSPSPLIQGPSFCWMRLSSSCAWPCFSRLSHPERPALTLVYLTCSIAFSQDHLVSLFITLCTSTWFTGKSPLIQLSFNNGFYFMFSSHDFQWNHLESPFRPRLWLL